MQIHHDKTMGPKINVKIAKYQRLPPLQNITSQNASSEAQVIFFVKKLCPVFKIFKFLYF